MDQRTPEYYEEHAVHMARVVLAAALLDDAVSTYLAEFLRLNGLQENALLRPMATRAKIDLLGNLAKRFLQSEDEKPVRKFCTQAKKALDERNALIHGVPADVGDKVGFVSWVGKQKLDPQPEPWPIERVFGLAAVILALTDQFERELCDILRKVPWDDEESSEAEG